MHVCLLIIFCALGRNEKGYLFLLFYFPFRSIPCWYSPFPCILIPYEFTYRLKFIFKRENFCVPNNFYFLIQPDGTSCLFCTLFPFNLFIFVLDRYQNKESIPYACISNISYWLACFPYVYLIGKHICMHVFLIPDINPQAIFLHTLCHVMTCSLPITIFFRSF